MKKMISVLLAVLCLALCLCACGNDGKMDEDTTTTTTTKATEATTTTQAPAAAFEVKVVDQNGNPVNGAMVQLCKDSCVPAKTNENGIATFSVEITDGYKLSVMSCPDGYTYTGEAEIYLESGSTSYTLELQSEA